MTARFARLIVAVAAAGLAGCNGPSGIAPRFTIASISPASGPINAATEVRILGGGFAAGATVTFGGVAAPAVVSSSTLITTSAPSRGAAGAVDVVVANPDGATARLSAGFSYVVSVVGLDITGETSLSGPGDRSQFTATATLADGSRSDVTAIATWRVSDDAASISSTGLLTARTLGIVLVHAFHGGKSSPQRKVIITPAGTFVLTGRAREPGAGSIAGVRVTHLGTGQSTTTLPATFVIAGVTSTRLSLSKDGYEPVEADGTANEFVDVAMQRVYRLGPEASSLQALAPNDMEYDVSAGGPRCQPCHLVRLTSATAGVMPVRVTWTEPGVPAFQIWANGQSFPGSTSARATVANVPVGVGDTLIYVGWSGGASIPEGTHISFTVQTGPVSPPASASASAHR
jgi:hypothetical protein